MIVDVSQMDLDVSGHEEYLTDPTPFPQKILPLDFTYAENLYHL